MTLESAQETAERLAKEAEEGLRVGSHGHVKPASSASSRHLPRARVIEMLNNFADGTYQAISPEVVGEAARHLQNSEPVVEGILAMTDAECLAAGIAEYGSEEAWRAAMATLRAKMLTTTTKLLAFDDMERALILFLKQWNACGPNSDFGRYFANVRSAAEDALAKYHADAAGPTHPNDQEGKPK